MAKRKDLNFMEQTKLDRINELAKKSREQELTQEEKQEQKLLREEYIQCYRKNLKQTLEKTYIVDEEGNKTKLNSKDE